MGLQNPSSTLTEIVTTTLRNRTGKLADNVTKNNALLYRLRRRGDLPPTNRASRSLVKFVFGEEDEHEEALYGTANHRVSEGSRGRYAGQGTVQEAWVQ
ncbi:hypothetical protein [Burkholderia pseudomallei]|uniref:hypothetical protein n=1 Tax=Burkholderia pseudomallei TaxID=28450 RepID=UPI00052A1968|nr:hypothetical protein [Burkholderia pseudomallei]AIV66753.1 hypothetical protein X993_5408 [Burkholderia pseudomallei K42]